MAGRTVWKYPLRITDGVQVLPIPEGSEIVHAGPNPAGAIAIWVEVSPESTPKEREFVVHGTGHPIPFGRHVGTIVMSPLVWHVYEVTPR